MQRRDCLTSFISFGDLAGLLIKLSTSIEAKLEMLIHIYKMRNVEQWSTHEKLQIC